MTINQTIRILFAGAVLGLCACAPEVEQRGYTNDADWKSQVIAGKSTKEQVQEALGSPSTRSSFGEETWFYISGRKESVAFLKPKVVEQDIFKITFDDKGVVKTAESIDEDKAQKFDLVDRTTPTEGHSVGLVEQLLGNIGRFNHPTDGVVNGREGTGSH